MYIGDWSSDVCSSDLVALGEGPRDQHVRAAERQAKRVLRREIHVGLVQDHHPLQGAAERIELAGRSEERRVGKECRARWSADHETKTEATCDGTGTVR